MCYKCARYTSGNRAVHQLIQERLGKEAYERWRLELREFPLREHYDDFFSLLFVILLMTGFLNSK